MDVRHLRYFVTVAEEQNFTRAATRLNVAQSALSQQILGLERELGVTLFRRTTRRVELTETGGELLGQARRAVQAFDATRVHARELSSGEAGRLRLGFVASAAYGLLPRLLLAHRRAHPQVQIELRELTTTQQVDALAAGELDVGIGRDLDADTELDVRHLTADPLIIALPADHALARRRRLACAELSGEPFITLPRQYAPRLTVLIESFCSAAGFILRPTLEARQFTTILGLVASDVGVAIVPACVSAFRPEGLVYRELRESVTSSIQLLTDPARSTSSARQFVRFSIEGLATD